MAISTPRFLRIALLLGIVSLTTVNSLLANDMTVQEFRERTERGDSFLLIDVREPYERAEFDLGGELIPLGDLQSAETITAIRSKLETYATDEIVVYDRSGRRGGTAQHTLIQNGFQNVRHLTGGVLAWIEAFGSVRPQLQPAAAPSSPPPEPQLPSTDSVTEDISANDPVAESPNDEDTFEVEPSASDSGGNEDVPPDNDAEEVEDEAAPEDGRSDEDLDENADIATEDAAEEGEEDSAPEDEPSDEDWGDADVRP